MLFGSYPAQRDLYRSNNAYQKLLAYRFIISVGLQPRWMNIILYIILSLIQLQLILCALIILLKKDKTYHFFLPISDTFFVFFVTAHTFNRYDHATGWFETLKIVPSHYETF